MTVLPTHITDRVRELSLAAKIRLLTGEDAWTTYALPEVGLRKLTVSDGPSGVRGPVWDERHRSLTLPSATCMAATWDVQALRAIGAIAAQEARSKGVDVVLGPTINLHRSPRGGRHFECYSEDPYLTGELAKGFIVGVQEQGVGACPKHYVGNDSENERFTYNAVIDEQTLHELYLAPFEAAVVEARAWTIMAAYNSVNGHSMTESPLLAEPLCSDWGFDGVVISDWTAVRSVEASANAAMHLAMPGPVNPWTQGLLAAVQAGHVDEATIDDKVARILLLAERVGRLGDTQPQGVTPQDARNAIRRIAAQGMVLVENNGVLPLPQTAQRIAVIGSHAADGRIGGGGSATTIPHSPTSPLLGIAKACAGTAEVTYTAGFHSVDELEGIPVEQCSLPDGTPGIDVQWLDGNGAVVLQETRYGGFLISFGEQVAVRTRRLVGRTRFTAVEDGVHRFGVGSAGHVQLRVNGELRLDTTPVIEQSDLAAVMLAPPQAYTDIPLKRGASVDLEFVADSGFPPEAAAISALFGFRAPRLSEQEEWDAALDNARNADVAVVVVGTTALVESEGYDRASLALPGRQDELVQAVLAVNPNTIVVVNAGSPVEMPWRKQAAATLLTWFPGEEFGNALADVLFGQVEPGGRLPTTWTATLADAPVQDTDPQDGQLLYSEGLNIGYRAWHHTGRTPAYWFGHGLGYTTWELCDLQAPVAAAAGEPVRVTATVRNTGTRTGSDVVQVYVRRVDTDVQRPALWLGAFSRVEAAAGATVEVELTVPARAFQHWAGSWQNEPGAFELLLARTAELDGAVGRSITID